MTGAAIRGLLNPFRSDRCLFLPGTKRRLIAITSVEDKGEKVGKSVEVKSAKP